MGVESGNEGFFRPDTRMSVGDTLVVKATITTNNDYQYVHLVADDICKPKFHAANRPFVIHMLPKGRRHGVPFPSLP